MNRKENMSAWEWFGTILRQLVNAGVEVVQRIIDFLVNSNIDTVFETSADVRISSCSVFMMK